MLNREYSPCIGSVFKGDVESAVSNFFSIGSSTLIRLSRGRELLAQKYPSKVQ